MGYSTSDAKHTYQSSCGKKEKGRTHQPELVTSVAVAGFTFTAEAFTAVIVGD
jgi:hypothetical protein